MKKVLFWVLSCTWGLVMALVGAVTALVLILTGHKPKNFHGLIYFETGYGWGGINLGPFFIVAKGTSLRTKQHEAGHGLQNVVLGPLMLFLVGLPSVVRYWARVYLLRSGKKKSDELPPYDAIWFEGWATALGAKYFKEVSD